MFKHVRLVSALVLNGKLFGCFSSHHEILKRNDATSRQQKGHYFIICHLERHRNSETRDICILMNAFSV